jgi:hypothetical protein
MRTAALVLFAGLVAVGPVVPAEEAPGVSAGPENIVVHEANWEVELVHDQLSFPTNLAFSDDRLLVLEAGRYPYAEPYDPSGECDPANDDVMNCGELTQLRLDEGQVVDERTLVDGLGDPIGLEVHPSGDVYLTQYNEVDLLPAERLDDTQPELVQHSTGYLPQTTDFVFAPVTGDHVTGQGGEATDANTTGPMGLAFHPDTGQVHVSHALHGTPPDDPVVREVTGLGYDNPYSSSVIAPDEGEIDPDEVAARACRNCFDLTFAPEGSGEDGELFIAENVGPYRARLSPGEGRTPLGGSTPADWNLLDGVNHVDLETGQITRVTTFRPDSGIFGVTPTGIEYSPEDFAGPSQEMFVSLMSGFVPMTDDRGEIVVAHPDVTTGVGAREHFVTGLDFPIDVAFGPDGAMYVLEFFDGQLWRFTPDGDPTRLPT